MIEGVPWLLAIVLAIAAFVSIARRRSGRGGAAAAGAVYDMLNEDRRKALEIIVEERAEARDPETADGSPRTE